MKVKKLPHRSLLFAGVFLTGAFFVKAISEEHTLSFPTNPNTKTTEEVIPLTISSGFDKDFIAEAKPAQTHSSERMDARDRRNYRCKNNTSDDITRSNDF